MLAMAEEDGVSPLIIKKNAQRGDQKNMNPQKQREEMKRVDRQVRLAVVVMLIILIINLLRK